VENVQAGFLIGGIALIVAALAAFYLQRCLIKGCIIGNSRGTEEEITWSKSG
jgi:hypothetical protein